MPLFSRAGRAISAVPGRWSPSAALSPFWALFFCLAVACSATPERDDSPESGDPGPAESSETGSTPDGGATATGPLVPVNENGEIVNRVRLVVGTLSISQLDIDRQMENLRRSPRPPRNLESAAVDDLITRAIVNIESERESIIVSDERMQNEIRRRQQAAGVEDLEQFQKMVTRQTGLPFDVWVSDLRFEIIKRQLVQIKLTVPQPGEHEIEKFYRANRNRVGIEIRYREMMFVPENGSIAEEQRVAKLAEQAYARVRSNPSAFSEVARSMPENASPLKAFGGLQDYTPIQELAERDQVLAGILFNSGEGHVPRPFRTSGNRYMVVLVEGKRPIPLNKVREQIRERLYYEKENEVFDRWLEKRRKEIAITSFD